MSTYQYYEFQSLDRPLDSEEMSQLRAISTRATITATSFVNEYHWGDLKANPWDLLDKYFDAFLYVASWGSCWLAFRIPNGAVDVAAVKDYETEASLNIRRGESHTILSFVSEEEECCDWDEGDGWLASLISLRSDIIRGDYRALYMAWLQEAQWDIEDDYSPPVPPGMGELSASLASLAEFIRLDDDLLGAASEGSAALPEQTINLQQERRQWIRSLDENAKDEFLCRAAEGDAAVQWELQKLFRQYQDRTQKRAGGDMDSRRAMALILASRDERVEQRMQEQAQAKERITRKQEAARKAYLRQLSERAESVRCKISELIATVQQQSYDRAVGLLVDLRDAAELKGHSGPFEEYLIDLQTRHARKTSLIARLDQAGL